MWYRYAVYLEYTPTLWKKETTQKVSSLQTVVHEFVDFPNAPLLYKPYTKYFTNTHIFLHSYNLKPAQNSFHFSFFSDVVAILNTLPYPIT